MNKDLDDRLIPNGEYRDAQNISVGKSEADDIGALETVLGNELVNGVINPVINAVNATAVGIQIGPTGAGSGISRGIALSTNYVNNTTAGFINMQVGMAVYQENPDGVFEFYGTITLLTWDGTFTTVSINWNGAGFGKSTVDGRTYRFGGGERPTPNTWIGVDYSGPVIYSSGDLTSQVYVGMVNNSGYAVTSVSYAAAPINQTTITLANGASVSSQFNPTVTYTLRWPVEIIGTFSSKSSNAIYIFSTDHTGVNQAPLDLTVLGSHHYIQKFSSTGFKTGTFTTLVQGGFLNFSIDNPLSGISLVEDLLFFTDNRNQPRKINIINGLVANYYTDESQISVAKYSPYKPISLLDKVPTSKVRQATTNNSLIYLSDQNLGVKKGMSVVGPSILASDFVYVTNIINTDDGDVLTLNKNVTTSLNDEINCLGTTMTGESISPYFNGVEMPANTNWPGDPDFLESRFVRFSYRFQFVDNEYSLMAPFTQIAFIPKQKGYFINGDEKNAYQSTVLEFMENGVQNIKLNVPLPDTGFNLNQSNSTYRINNIDILYKESDGLVVKVLDSISISDLSALTTSTYGYEYQSRKPFRTLPQAQTTRVFDKVPVKALAQEIAGNRVIYGNFQNQHTPPSSIDYYVTTGDKFTTNSSITNWAEYPNSTLKQNRNYQVGFILSDKYGRSSSVILSSVKDSGVFLNGLQYGGSTVFAGYNSLPSNIKNWFGDSLQVVINQPIEQTTNVANGAPGLYAVPLSNASPPFVGFDTTGTTIVINNSLTNPTMTFNLATGAVNGGVPVADSYLRGEYKDFVKVLSVVNNDSTTGQTTSSGGGNSLFLTTLNTAIIPGMVVSGFAGGGTAIVSVIYPPQNNKSVIGLASSVAFNSSEVLTFTSSVSLVTCDGAINLDLYSTNPSASAQDPDIKFAYNLPNATGWYSYKIVVRQQEQDYYNVYLPGLLRGYPTQISPTPSGAIPFPSGEENNTANIVLLNDNINKIPRDLNETSDQQRQFRSSVQLFSRVLNDSATTNIQSYPGILTDTAINISTAIDSNMIYSQLSTAGKENLYQIDTNPLVARIDTSATKGVLSATMVPFLAIYETEPQESLLDIYWETSQTGLLADINADIRTGFEGAVGFSSMSMDFDENNIPGDVNGAGGNYGFITSYFYPINAQGAEIPQTAANKATIAWTVGGGASDGEFALYQETAAGTNFGRYRIQQLKAFTFIQTSPTTSEIDFTFVVKDQNGLNPGTILLTTELKNTAPCFTDANGACVTSFDSITKTVQDQIIETYTAVNGTASATASDKTSGLIYSITDASGLFEINQNGVLQKINPSNVPIGNYDVTITITDAYIAPNYVTPINGSDFTSKSVSIVQNIVIGPEPVNTGVESTWACKSVSSYTAGIPQPGQIRTNPAGGAAIYGGWYLAASAMSSTDSSLAFLSNAGNGLNPISADPASGDFTTWHRIGTAALTKGTINFSCNMSQKWTTDPGQGFPGVESNTIWRVYYRSATNVAWALATDINNFIPQAPGTTTNTFTSSWDGTNNNPNTPSNPGTGGTYTAYGQVNFAYDTPGEYLILAVATTVRAAVNADLAASWINANDLNYSECVVFNGAKQETVGGDKYTYSRSGPVAGYVTTGGSSGNRFAQVPYSEYVSVFYTSNSLNVVETAATPFYYYYSPINSMVYNTGLSVAKFTATGIKTSGDPNTCNDLLARGTAGACGKPVSQGSNNLY
tara:strand:- start:719 stop:5869 length:5151 start_codon:yes stop_codon:yes gene_type:complete